MAFENELTVLWTTDNLITSRDMVFMYTVNAKKNGWFENVILVIWGATAKLTAENEEVQGWVKDAIEAGVSVTACKACADRHGVSEKLETLGIDVDYLGVALSDRLKANSALLTV